MRLFAFTRTVTRKVRSTVFIGFRAKITGICATLWLTKSHYLFFSSAREINSRVDKLELYLAAPRVLTVPCIVLILHSYGLLYSIKLYSTHCMYRYSSLNSRI